MTTMRAKLQVGNIDKFEGDHQERVTFHGVAASSYPADGSDENNTYARYSPAASCSITIANPALIGKFKPGDTFYVDFTPA